MITLIREYFEDRTEGSLLLPDGTELRTLERPWLDNKVSVSCIPEGQYIVDRDKTGRWQWYKLRDVEGRTFIEIHPANRVSQLEGCIAPCMRIRDGVGYESTKACELLLEWFDDESWVLDIRR